MDQALEQIVMVALVRNRAREVIFRHQRFFVQKMRLGYIPQIFKKINDPIYVELGLLGWRRKKSIDFI
jgi:hypothetical protein